MTIQPDAAVVAIDGLSRIKEISRALGRDGIETTIITPPGTKANT